MKVNSNIYNHLGANTVPKKRTTTHKSSELKAIYTKMAQYNKSSPLYMLSLSDSKQEQIINIKESALSLRYSIQSFGNPEDDIYSKKAFSSSDNSSVSGSLKKPGAANIPESLDIQIDTLATEQVNVSKYVKSNEFSLVPKEHRFTLETLSTSAHFGITVNKGDSNADVQSKLVNYINNRNIGVNASLIKDGDNTAIMLTSAETGKPATDDGLHFSFVPEGAGQNLVNVFELNNVRSMPSNSSFSINGDQHISSSNHISINQAIELDFHKTTQGPVKVGLTSDPKKALEQLESFTSAYNGLIDISSNSPSQIGTRSLSTDIAGVLSKYKANMESIGITTLDDGKLSIDSEKVTQSLASGEFTEFFTTNATIATDIENATNRLVLDPIAYVNKTIVSYPNASNKLNNTYTQSLYSGLMYNNYA
ncbi:MAG: hypothetical protein IKJ73_00410 [Lachnospiraceae bacterium]|nr:hypothetical protein [Lachnospiraceae bacterium]